MASPMAGWYPDPSGDVSRLRYWDGVQWTDNFMDAAQAASAAEAAAQATPAATAATAAGAGATAATAQPQPNYEQQYATQPPQPQAEQPYGQPQPQYAPQYTAQPVYAPTDVPIYAVSKEDQTLRLIAFILMIVCAVSMCWMIVPLAWCIPMCIRAWKIYKGQKPNTVAFGVCTLLFVSLVSGILLLVSTKEQ